MPIQPALGSEHRSGNAAREVAYVRQRGLTYLREGPSKWRRGGPLAPPSWAFAGVRQRSPNSS